MAAEAEALPAETPPGPAPGRDPHVRCRSCRSVAELLGCCKSHVRALGDEQPVETETLQWALGEAVWNFETAVQDNITVNGQPWQESPSNLQNGADIKPLEDQLDELVVEVASKRNHHPKKIKAHVVKSIKTQQKMLGCYQPVVKPQETKATPCEDSHMADLRLSAEAAARHIGNSFQFMTSLLGKAEGFSTVLSWQPTLELCKIRQEVFSSSQVKAENQTESKTLTEQVEVISPETAISSSVILKIKRPSCSPQRKYPLRRRKIGLDT
ncbi:kinetochore-associated protein NSL1 homolog [Sphaerodactylus townsendi]|uniref:kinetochore-associated protein NSL1 homolog n=1 Tax=Sphaerodactylus townsendi TaxID=933632 RepID=UPI00202600B2|nr:kinetochore-associated protein NSL1 homolog [Sphaerodactylus townsendi]